MRRPSRKTSRRRSAPWDEIRAARTRVERALAEARRDRAEQEAKAAMEQATVAEPIRRALERNGFSALVEDAFAGRQGSGR